MAKNYMKEVANLLGLELEEEFRIKGYRDFRWKFTQDKLLYNYGGKLWYVTPSLHRLLNGSLEIEKPILDKQEKEYLSAVIKPFRSMVFGITKYTQYVDGNEYITISIKEETGDHLHMSLPCFKVGTMYKGMKSDEKYSLEELGL